MSNDDGAIVIQRVSRLPKRGRMTPRVEKALGLYRQLITGDGDVSLLPTLVCHELARMDPAEQAAYYKANHAICAKDPHVG